MYKTNYLLNAKIKDSSVSCFFNPTDVLTALVSFAMTRHQQPCTLQSLQDKT